MREEKFNGNMLVSSIMFRSLPCLPNEGGRVVSISAQIVLWTFRTRALSAPDPPASICKLIRPITHSIMLDINIAYPCRLESYNWVMCTRIDVTSALSSWL